MTDRIKDRIQFSVESRPFLSSSPFLINMDGMSSPLAIPSSLPPSSAPDPTLSAVDRTPRRPTTDALALGDEAEEDNGEQSGSKRRRARTQGNGEVPLVKDAVGESVAESFESFLKTYASMPLSSSPD